MNNSIFESWNLSPELLAGITDMGFTSPTPIQEQSIPLALSGKDIIGQAQTGTGKTASFGIPLIEQCDPSDKSVSALVLCPTRELAVQIAGELRKIAKHKKHVEILPVYGGASMPDQIRKLKKGVQIVVGTPGRIMDHMERKTLKLQNLQMLVLDEADEMLNMGFRDDIELILKSTPDSRQTLLFSATMPPPIREIAKKYQKNPELVKVTDSNNLTAKSIEQAYYEVKGSSKVSAINSILQVEKIKLGLVFCNTKRKVDEITAELKKIGISAAAIHGDLSQQQRNYVLADFKNGALQLLVATDVAARGIDVNNIDGVFNYDVPNDPEYYVHRIGRTGRAGKTGKSFSFVSGRDDMRRLKSVENYARISINKKELPTASDMYDHLKTNIYAELKEVMEKSNLKQFEQMVADMVSEGADLERTTAALLKMLFKESESINAPQSISIGKPDRFDSGRKSRQGGRSNKRPSFKRKEFGPKKPFRRKDRPASSGRNKSR